MKRVMSDQMDIINMAGSLMLLSQGGGAEDSPDRRHLGQPSSAVARVFECKTCKRQFPSFQALGGHRASHKKPRVVGDGGANVPGHGKPRVHECSVCGLEFAIGQALGGHMRRHRAEGGGFGHGHGLGGGEKKRVWLDLNLPPSENEMECRKKMGFGIEIVDNIPVPMVDCFH